MLVVGQGYVGLPLALAAVSAGFDVVGVDVDVRRIDALVNGRSPVRHIDDHAVTGALGTGRYRAVPVDAPGDGPAVGEDAVGEDAIGVVDVAVICVPTPLTDGRPDLGHVEAAASLVGRHLAASATVVLESTTWPGTTCDVVRPLVEASCGRRVGPDLRLGYSPERIDPGNPEWDLVNTPKIVAGVDEASLAAVEAFYGSFVDILVPVATCEEAELAKLLENTYRHVNIALVNEMARYARAIGVDIGATIAAATKPFGFAAFLPGPGVGGHCLPVDPRYLTWHSQQAGTSMPLVELANEINEAMPHHVVARIVAGLEARRVSVPGAEVLVLGLAYKADTGDRRGAPSTVVCEKLVARGARVRALDPLVDRDEVRAALPTVELLHGAAPEPATVAAADVVVVMVTHSAFGPEVAALVAEEAPWVFDTRRWLPPGPRVEQL